MAKLIVGTFVIAVMFCGAASANDEGVIGVGAGTVGVETPTGLPAGTSTATATATATATFTATPTQTIVPTKFETILDGDSCAVVEPQTNFGGWWLAIIPPAIVWRRRHRTKARSRSDE